MSSTRREWLARGLGGAALLATASSRSVSALPAASHGPVRQEVAGKLKRSVSLEVPDYGIIYNWDGSPHGYSEVPQSMEEFLEKVYAPLEDTQVGALFWCLGTHGATWKSEVVEPVGDVHGRRYESARSYTSSENVRQMLERGEDPQAALIQRGHKLGLHVYASVRMNDNHFEGTQIEDLKNAHLTELTRMRIEHPEWLLGNQTSEWFALSWNFAVPEVRQHRLDHIEELCRLYDWDGVELDWQRHAFHLPRDHAYRLRYVLTDLQRAVRQMTNRLAKKRGRPFYIAVRVAPTLEMCRRIGYDVPTWIEENLMDIIVPAGGYGMDPSIEVNSYLSLCRESGVQVYPGLDVALDTLTTGVHSGHEPFVGPEERTLKDKMRNRAVAAGYHKAGVHGVYVFNWHADRAARRELLTQIGSAATLRRTDKIYAATYRSLITEGPWRGALRNDRILGPVPVALKPTLTGDGPTIVLEVADDLATDRPSAVELRLRLDQWVQGDKVRVLWDGLPRTNMKTQYHQAPEANAWDRISDVSSAVWLSSSFTHSERPSPGRHEVKVLLERRNPRMVPDLVLTNVELVITYS